jgi:hypothetical protein
VLTDLTGQVVLEHGVATFTDLSFGVPGAAARMHGTYGLIDHKIDLHGQMHVLTKISNTTRKTAVSTSRERRPKSFGISRSVLMLLRPILAQFHKGAEQLRVEAQPSLRSK